MPDAKHIEVTLDPAEALDQVEASLEGLSRWRVERDPDALELRIYPSNPLDYQLDPKLEVYEDFPYPEPLAVEVVAEALVEGSSGGGASVSIELVRHRQAELNQAIVRRTLNPLATGGPSSLAHGIRRLRWRERRKRGKLRMLRLAIEPLIPHERGDAAGPFRDDR